MALGLALPAGILVGTVGTLGGIAIALSMGESGVLRTSLFVWPTMTVALTVFGLVRVRARRLTTVSDGLVLTRDGCQITMLWRDFEQVRERRFGPVRLEELVFREGDVRPLDAGAPFINKRIEKFRRTGVDRRIQPSFFVPGWRESPLGVV
jgi:hypothetical protein